MDRPRKFLANPAVGLAVGVVTLLLAAGAALPAEGLATTPGAAAANRAYEAALVIMPSAGPGVGLSSAGMGESSLGAFTINLVPGTGLAGNSAALAAFGRAAAQWSRFISDPITVNIDADMQNLGSTTIIGQAESTMLMGDYTEVQNAMVADADADDGILAFLPTLSQFNVHLPTGFGFNGNISATKGNFKALGYTGLDEQFGASDATITFNSGFAFDYDKSNGVSPGMVDFESVAAHEIGHALGFISNVDTIDEYESMKLTANLAIGTLDMFRFDNDGADDPSTAAQFATFPRYMLPGNDDVFDDIAHEWRMSTGYYMGDGRQASHWKDDTLTGTFIGIMDPTIDYQQIWTVGMADLRALDLIGYDIVPEPATLTILALGALAMPRRRRKA